MYIITSDIISTPNPATFLEGSYSGKISFIEIGGHEVIINKHAFQDIKNVKIFFDEEEKITIDYFLKEAYIIINRRDKKEKTKYSKISKLKNLKNKIKIGG